MSEYPVHFSGPPALRQTGGNLHEVAGWPDERGTARVCGEHKRRSRYADRLLWQSTLSLSPTGLADGFGAKEMRLGAGAPFTPKCGSPAPSKGFGQPLQ